MVLNNLNMKLSDGRTLGFSECGDPNGYPVFFFHGTPGSRLQAVDFHDAASTKHCRFFGIDRSGMGISSLNPRHTLLSWADDIRQLANHLNIDKFSIIAHSGGAPFAMACAYAIPERIANVAIVSGLAPTTLSKANIDLKLGLRIVNILMRNIPGIAWIFMQLHRSMLSHPNFFKRTLQQLPKPDRLLLNTPEQFNAMMVAQTETFRQGAQGAAHEFWIILNSWPFDLSQITCPVSIFQGKLDSHVPLSFAELYKTLLPNASLYLFDHEAHLSMLYNRVDEILESIRPSR